MYATTWERYAASGPNAMSSPRSVSGVWMGCPFFIFFSILFFVVAVAVAQPLRNRDMPRYHQKQQPRR